MGGCSLTLMWLDDELERLWRADAYTPAYRKAGGPLSGLRAPSCDELAGAAAVVTAPEASAAARRLAGTVRDALAAAETMIREHEHELGRIDAVAGDGDHGRGMLKGITAATARIADLGPEVGGGWLLQQAGQAWAERAGGTSGVLWGAAMEAFGRHLGDVADSYPADAVTAGVGEFANTIVRLGGARPGDKTLLDALLPFVEDLERRVAAGDELAPAWVAAAEVATRRARDTAGLRPRIGRARPLAEKSVGTPDAGATSMALIVTAVGRVLEEDR